MQSSDKPKQSIHPTATNQEKRIAIGNNVFIVGNHRYYERKELLCSKYFKHNKVEAHEVVHLNYYNHFMVRKKRLAVAARYYFTRAPYGDRIKLKATYDGVCIGEFGLLKSTIGAGTSGKHPEIKNEEWQLIIKLDLNANERGYMHFYVEYFERISEAEFQIKSELMY